MDLALVVLLFFIIKYDCSNWIPGEFFPLFLSFTSSGTWRDLIDYTAKILFGNCKSMMYLHASMLLVLVVHGLKKTVPSVGFVGQF